MYVSPGWQLPAWVSHSPSGGLASLSRLTGSLSCWSQGYKCANERTVSDIQVSSCVMNAKVQLAKARQPCAKLTVGVEGNYEGLIPSWELLQPFSVNNLPHPVSANAYLCSNIIFYPFNINISTSRLFWFTSLYMSLPISLSPTYKNKF